MLGSRAHSRHIRVGLFVQIDSLMPVPLEAALIACDICPQGLVPPEMGVRANVYLLLDIFLHSFSCSERHIIRYHATLNLLCISGMGNILPNLEHLHLRKQEKLHACNKFLPGTWPRGPVREADTQQQAPKAYW